MAAKNKCLAQSNKSSGRAETTKGATNRVPPMSNILKSIDLTDHAIRRVVFAVLDRLAAEHRAVNERLSVRGLAPAVSWQFDPEQVEP